MRTIRKIEKKVESKLFIEKNKINISFIKMRTSIFYSCFLLHFNFNLKVFFILGFLGIKFLFLFKNIRYK